LRNLTKALGNFIQGKQEPHYDHYGLDKIRKGNRPHATQKGVKDHHQRTYNSSKLYANTGGYAQDQAYGKHLGTDPTKIRRYD
jgi:hypothetical protein